MIRYTLKCDNNHVFESWFASAEGYERLRAANLATCAVCGSSQVEKSLMAPQVHTKPARRELEAPGSGCGSVSGPGAMAAALPEPVEVGSKPVSLSTPETPLAQAIERLRAEIEASSDYVGADFVQEARAMHSGDAPERSIHGEANADEARKLAEDGVPVLPLPFANRSKSN